MNNKLLKLLMFIAVGAGAYVALQLLGQGSIAWETLQTSLKQPLEGLLATAMGSAAALLIPGSKKPAPATPPSQPEPTEIRSSEDQPSVPLDEYNRVAGELDRWRRYGVDMDGYVEHNESLRAILDTRQAVLRVATYSILGLAFCVSLAGFLAPSIVLTPGSSVTANLLFQHLGILACAYVLVGCVLGAVVFRIRVHTFAWHAGKCALIAALVLNLSAFLVSLPYVFVRMWNQPISFSGMTLPMLIWMALFRLGAFPLICMACAYVGFHTARLFSRSST